MIIFKRLKNYYFIILTNKKYFKKQPKLLSRITFYIYTHTITGLLFCTEFELIKEVKSRENGKITRSRTST